MNKEVGLNKEVENLINGLENREILELKKYEIQKICIKPLRFS